MSKGFDTKEFRVIPLANSGGRPFVVKWGVIYFSTAILVTVFVLIMNFIFVLYPGKVDSYSLATSIDTSRLLTRLNQVQAQATPELRIYNESSLDLLDSLMVFHEENKRLRNDNDLSSPVLSPADATDPALNLESASFRDPATIATELSSQTTKALETQDNLSIQLPAISRDSENIAWIKARTPSRYPLHDGHEREITSDYGWRLHPIYKTVRMHHGVDFHGPTGEELLVVADGVVTKSGRHFGYGYTVKVLHRKQPRIETLYGHILGGGLRCEVGDIVKRGDVIGLMGNTGVSTGTHVHFEVRVNGKSVDPKDYVLKNWGCGGFPELEEETVEE